MVEVPDDTMARFVIEQALEYGEYKNVSDSAYEGEYGEFEFETDWSLNDLDPESCDVDIDGSTIVVSDFIEADYSVQVSRGSRHHPPEYENRTTTLEVSIEMDMDTLPIPTISVW